MSFTEWIQQQGGRDGMPVREADAVLPLLRNGAVGSTNISWHYGMVSSQFRQHLLQQRPVTIWLTGLSGAGKSSIAYALEKRLLDRGQCGYVLDGDNLRHHINSDLGFSEADRSENIRRAAEVAYLMNEAGLIVIAAFISPSRKDRELARRIITGNRFVEVHVSTPADICETRDHKGLYARARRGEIAGFTGVSAPYEKPLEPELELNTAALSVQSAANRLYEYLFEHCYIK